MFPGHVVESMVGLGVVRHDIMIYFVFLRAARRIVRRNSTEMDCIHHDLNSLEWISSGKAVFCAELNL